MPLPAPPPPTKPTVRLVPPEALPALDRLASPLALAAARVARDAADAHLLVQTADGAVQARASLWWRGTPPWRGRRTAVLGHYAATDDAAGRALLDAAVRVAADQGCPALLGPMDGATWRSYRFVTDAGTQPPFFLEPRQSASYPRQFEAAGFVPVAHYRSALIENLDAAVQALPPRAAPRGVRLRPLRMERFDATLDALYDLTTHAFASNAFYTVPPRAAFCTAYAALRTAIDPDLVLLVEAGRRLVGVCLLLPDHAQPAPDTVIFKTMALHPDLHGQGLGRWLAAEAHRTARRHGYRRAIHALMHDANASGRISAAYGTTMRRYALYARSTCLPALP